jgi:hypothetical protein
MIFATLTRPGKISAMGITLTHRTPVLQLARALIAGLPLPLTAEQDALTVLCDGKPVMYASITAAAGMTVSENANSGPRFAKWSPFTGVGEEA